MTDLSASALHRFAIVEIKDEEARRIHFGSVRLTERWAVLHEETHESDCCANVVVLIPISMVGQVEVYADQTAPDEAKADQRIAPINGVQPRGMEVG